MYHVVDFRFWHDNLSREGQLTNKQMLIVIWKLHCEKKNQDTIFQSIFYPT